jgi:hypothetical protein
MFKRALFIVLGIAACLTIYLIEVGQAQTHAAFWGYIRYLGPGCHCVNLPYHAVSITKDGEIPNYHRIKCSGTSPGYNTLGYTFTAGYYTFSVPDLTDSGCRRSEIKRVYYNGIGSMQVDLNLHADYPDSGPPSGP